MYTLTEIRFKKAKEILDRHNRQFMERHELQDGVLERELRDVWDTGYREIKDIMIQLSKRPEYRLMALRYMESGCPGPVTEFWDTLATAYGMDYYGADDREQKQTAFWERAFAN